MYIRSHLAAYSNGYLSVSRLASNIGLLEKDAEATCVARFRLLQAKRDPLLQHGSPSRLFRDASHTLPSSFSMQRAKLDDLEPGKGLGCQVTRLVCQVLNMPPSQQCLADGHQCSALTSTTQTHMHSGSHYLNLKQTGGCIMVSTPYRNAN